MSGKLHSALFRRATTIILSAVLALTLAGPAMAAPPTGGEEEAGNNLSYPVIWAEGSQLTLTGDPATPNLVTPVDFNGVDVFLQGTENTWQAGSMTAPDDGAGGLTDVGVSTFDWGDNLEAKSWPLGQNTQLRVEAVLYRDLAADTAFPPMDAFEMLDIDANPDDQVESWGTTGTVSASPRRRSTHSAPDSPSSGCSSTARTRTRRTSSGTPRRTSGPVTGSSAPCRR